MSLIVNIQNQRTVSISAFSVGEGLGKSSRCTPTSATLETTCSFSAAVTRPSAYTSPPGHAQVPTLELPHGRVSCAMRCSPRYTNPSTCAQTGPCAPQLPSPGSFGRAPASLLFCVAYSLDFNWCGFHVRPLKVKKYGVRIVRGFEGLRRFRVLVHIDEPIQRKAH